MHRRRIFIPLVIFFLTLSFLVFAYSKKSTIHRTSSFIGHLVAPVQLMIFSSFQKIRDIREASEMQNLKNDNARLIKKIVDQKMIIQENTALKDQFQTENPSAQRLLPAHIIGAPSFIPGLTIPEYFILDKGLQDGIKVGQVVIYKQNVIGKINKATNAFSEVVIVIDKQSSFTAKTLETSALGVIRGQGNTDMLLDNVVLSDKLHIGDIVVTNGDGDIQGKGYLPGLIVGKISAIEKEPSALFQHAKIHPLIDFTRLTMIFVVIEK